MATKIEKNLKEKLKQLLRPIVNKVPNKLRYGRYYRNFYKEIDNFFNLKIEEKKDIQLKKIQQIVEYAYFNVPYYRELFDKNNISYKIKTFDDFEKIPYLTKDIIKENLENLKSIKNIKCNKITTGGTTGMPMEFYLDKEVCINEIAFVDYYWNKFNSEYINSKKIAVLRGNIPSNGKKFEVLGNRMIMSSFELKNQNINEYIERLEKFNPDYIHIYPSSLSIIANFILQNNIELKLERLKGIFSSSETLKNSQRKVIEKAFNVKICDLYGHSERAVIAFDNINGEEYTLDLFYGYTEVINDEGINIINQKGKIGEVVATSFWNKSMPLIRYKTGDNAITSGNYDSLNKIFGRKSEYFIDKNNNKILFTCADEPFWECKEKIEAYQYIQDEIGECELKIVKSNKLQLEQKDEKNIKKELKRLYPNINFNIRYVNKIERTSRGKYRYLIQNIKVN